MNLTNKKRMAARLLKVGESRVWFDPERLSEIKEAITKADIRRLIQDYAIQAKPATGVSRFRAKKIAVQKRKGRQTGEGSKKGTFRARLPKKQAWMAKIRSQRIFIKDLKDNELVKPADYRKIYLMCKGSFFRSIRHIKLYMEEHKMFVKKEKKWSASKASGPSKEQE
ncbi:MAG: 50S ribosomal protein L19e [Candidatus Nanoarchaeia archaeon]|nr:50S ribosomal protein L19e [Candidatus Nanoarchaeia archaeon]